MNLPERFDGLPVRELPGGLRLVQADTWRARLRGLGGLAALPPDQALEIPASAIHTLTMRFALDLIWLDRDGRVLRVDREVPRRRMRLCPRARACVETAAGRGDAFVAALARR